MPHLRPGIPKGTAGPSPKCVFQRKFPFNYTKVLKKEKSPKLKLWCIHDVVGQQKASPRELAQHLAVTGQMTTKRQQARQPQRSGQPQIYFKRGKRKAA